MKTIFLAAGRSTRLHPLRDKNILSFCGEPLIIKLLKNAKSGGLENFIIVANTENKPIIETLLTQFQFPAQVVLQKETDPGMAGAVKSALTLIDDQDAVFLLGGNDFVNPNIYKKILSESKKYDGLLLAQKVKTYFPGGYLDIDENQIIKSIVEKPGAGNEPSDLVNIVAHFFQKAQNLKIALENTASEKDDHYEVALQSLFNTLSFKAEVYDDYWKAIKYPWHILDMMELFLSQQNLKNEIHKSVFIADTARIRGEKVYIEEGVKIFDNAVIQGPCYIGKNAIIGNNALIRQSHIGEGCTIGYNTEIARSYLAQNIETHIAYIGDSVIDEKAHFGAYACTANLRLDQKEIKVNIKDDRVNSERIKLGSIVGAGAQIGIHAMLMPGSKVDKEEFIAPGVVHK